MSRIVVTNYIVYYTYQFDTIYAATFTVILFAIVTILDFLVGYQFDTTYAATFTIVLFAIVTITYIAFGYQITTIYVLNLHDVCSVIYNYFICNHNSIIIAICYRNVIIYFYYFCRNNKTTKIINYYKYRTMRREITIIFVHLSNSDSISHTN